jgi:hypothetical protein
VRSAWAWRLSRRRQRRDIALVPGDVDDLVLDVTGDDGGGNSLSVGHAPLPEHEWERERRQLGLR